MTLNENLTADWTTQELDNIETFILQAWLLEADEYMMWCEDNDVHTDYDAVYNTRQMIADEIEAR